MRIFFVAIVCILSSLFVNGQRVSDRTIDRFNRFYKAGSVDSIYKLFSPQMKNAVSPEGSKQLVKSLKDKLGDIVKTSQILNADTKILEFRLAFEKPVVEIAVMVQDSLIIGIRQKMTEPDTKDSVSVESVDNFAVNNGINNIYGTLVMPAKSDKVPVILLIGGSGPTDRNMNQVSVRTNSFFMLSKELASMGIATLRYDKRGVGKSASAKGSGDLTFDDFINDADILVKKLSADPRFSKIIVLGHSEGASIGLITALHTHPDAFISLSGYADDYTVLLRKQLRTAAKEEDFKIASEILDSLKEGKLVHRKIAPDLMTIFNLPAQKFIISSVRYSSSVEISKLKIPVLVIGGSTDLQVDNDNARKLAGGNKHARLKLIEGMNHVLKNAPADRNLNLQTYNDPRLPVNHELVTVITGFINNVP